MRSHKFQAPKGTRDFLPADMAVRRHIESIWRGVSICHGFDEVDGPTFEHLELYTVKSGPGIVSELFSFRRAGGDTDYALRPEFTPTLARLVAAHGGGLPKPIRWFCMPPMFRAERPQRGRLREHIQWNADVIGDDSPRADAEIVSVAAGVLEGFGLSPAVMQIKLSDRDIVCEVLKSLGLGEEGVDAALQLLDRRAKMTPEAFATEAAGLGMDEAGLAAFDRFAAHSPTLREFLDDPRADVLQGANIEPLEQLARQIDEAGLADWCHLDFSIVRGLAYYTGTVFEVHETTGRERAVAGGGRYDNLVELFGGVSTPAVGFAMGDVVIRLVLEDHGLLETPEQYLPRPDAFVINALEDGTAARSLIASLRRAGLHVRHSARTTRNVGKLLSEAAKSRARFAVIVGREFEGGEVALKDLESGEQEIVPVAELMARLTG